MDSIHIRGGIPLKGEVCIQGSKNAALPILAAALLTGGCSYIKNCPRISDVYAMTSLLQSLGCSVRWQGRGVLVDSSRVRRGDMCSEAVRGMRSSLCLLGAMLGRCGQVVMEYPGGCAIGARPIDLHIAALEQMGAVFEEESGLLKASAAVLRGAEIRLPRPSVGATENVILAAVMAQGDTLLEEAAREPEITHLCRYLECCGACIEGIGTGSLLVRGGRALRGADFEAPADRVVAGTYLLACIGTGGSVLLKKAPADEMQAVLELAGRMGGKFCVSGEGIYVQGPERPESAGYIETAVYPGFPTDLQSVALAVETIGEGETVIEEKIFENRFRVVDELWKMGACIELPGESTALVRGVSRLRGAKVEAKELRGGAALVAAGLMAGEETRVSDCRYICRGYENICRDLRELGARIVSV